jgi:CheY-like chemotaxis protein
MSGALDVLVVDDRPETVRFLTEFLLQRCRRVDVAASVKEAMTFITRRQAAGEGYNLIFSDFVMPGADGLSFLRELRMRKDETPFVFITGYRSLNPALDSESKRLGALAILDKPIELREVEQLLNQATATFRRSKEQSGDVPFFGTSRTMRRPTAPSALPPTQPSPALEPRAPSEPLAMPTNAGWQAPSAALEPRQPQAIRPQSLPDALQPQPAAPPPPPQPVVPLPGNQRRPSAIIAVGSTTARIRRGVDPTAPAQQGTGRVSRMATPQPPTSFTARVRRGVEGTGSFRNPAARTESGRMVTCASCGKTFLTLAKAEAYTTVCVHCGQLQRIEPA